jgi:hypothetical protein
MKYINKNTGDTISKVVYNQLSTIAKNNFIPVSDESNKTHQIIETRSENLSVGDGIAVAVALPLLFLNSFFD